MQILSVIFGIILLIGGSYCFMAPVATFASLGWLVGAAMLVEGIASVVTWNTRKQLGLADGWTLVGAIVSIVLGIVVLTDSFARFGVDAFLAYLMAFWLIVGGVMRIAAAFGLRRIHMQDPSIGGMWWLLLIAGILVIIAGVIGVINPMYTVVSVGMLMGISITVSGCSLIASAFVR